jgi:hypothetical protein
VYVWEKGHTLRSSEGSDTMGVASSSVDLVAESRLAFWLIRCTSGRAHLLEKGHTLQLALSSMYLGGKQHHGPSFLKFRFGS